MSKRVLWITTIIALVTGLFIWSMVQAVLEIEERAEGAAS